MLTIQRRPINRPFDFDERLRRTQQALRYIRVSDRGAITLLEREDDATPQNTRPIYPSFAVLQLYLLNDSAYGATYVQVPLQFIRPGLIDYNSSSTSARSLVRSLVTISVRIGELRPQDTAAVLTNEPALRTDHPDIYTILRATVLQQLNALRGLTLTNQLLDYVYTQRWKQKIEVLRLLGSLGRQLIELRGRLNRGGELTRVQSNELAQAIGLQVVEQLVPDLLREAREAGPIEQPQKLPPPVAPVKSEPSEVVNEELEPSVVVNEGLEPEITDDDAMALLGDDLDGVLI